MPSFVRPGIAPSPVNRVVLIILDGLRPDAIAHFHLGHVARFARTGASTLRARTVNPSITPCAMATLLTGAPPDVHGVRSERIHVPRPRGPVHPIAKELARCSMPTSFFMPRVPFLMRGIASRIASLLGLGEVRFHGSGARDVLASARTALERQRRGLIVMHWLDADCAGHESGWMSPEYGAAAAEMDAALGEFTQIVDLEDPSTLVIALADHGGGGATRTHHDSEHPLDTTIPVMLAGGSVRPGDLGEDVTLIDVPATILWALGVARPASYAGRPLLDAFGAMPLAA